MAVPKDTLVIRAAEQIGVQIPRFCDHPLLAPVGACRQCLVEVWAPRNGELAPMGKPQASCTLAVTDGMVVRTQATSKVADKAQQGVMEFLLINHPLDCPVCDKGGECPLQNQAMSNGRGESRFTETKRTFPKPINISAQVLLDRERCVLCARCTRFSEQIAGDPFIALIERGALQQVGIYEKEPFESYFSGQHDPDLPGRRADLGGVPLPFPAVRPRLHAVGVRALRVRLLAAHRPPPGQGHPPARRPRPRGQRGVELRQGPLRVPATPVRRTGSPRPLVRDEQTGEHRPASWPEAFAVAARGLQAHAGKVGVLTGGRLTGEDAYAYSKFARVALGTNDIDFRARAHSAEEAGFLAAHVVGKALDVTYADLEKASVVLLAGLEPEDESPIVFLRLRKAARKGRTKVVSIAPFTSRGLQKMHGTLIRTAPGDEPSALEAVAHDGEIALDAGGVILVGERLASVPGALSAALTLAGTTGARLAWVPRRAGERGALETGCLPNLLPGGRPVVDAAARVDLGTVWGTTVPHEPGRDGDAIVAAAAAGEITALVVAGVDPVDLPDPVAAAAAIENAGFVVSLEVRASAVSKAADVVFPVAPVAEKAGMFVDWEGRVRPFEKVLRDSHALPDLRVLSGIADEMGVRLGFRTIDEARAEMQDLGAWDGERAQMPELSEPHSARTDSPSDNSVRVASWKLLIDEGRMLDGEPYLKATARKPVALVSATTLADLGLTAGELVEVSGERGTVTLPVGVADLPEGVVWTPAIVGSAASGSDVRLVPKGAQA